MRARSTLGVCSAPWWLTLTSTPRVHAAWPTDPVLREPGDSGGTHARTHMHALRRLNPGSPWTNTHVCSSTRRQTLDLCQGRRLNSGVHGDHRCSLHSRRPAMIQQIYRSLQTHNPIWWLGRRPYILPAEANVPGRVGRSGRKHSYKVAPEETARHAGHGFSVRFTETCLFYVSISPCITSVSSPYSGITSLTSVYQVKWHHMLPTHVMLLKIDI